MKKRILSIVLALAMLLPGLGLLASAAPPPYKIGNPYASVDWESWKCVKTQLHVHTNASDGADPRDVVIEEHFRLGFEALALTDHMTVGTAWNVVPTTVPVMRLVKRERTQMLPVTALTDARRHEIMSGTPERPGMMEITQGIELNGAVPNNSHLNGFFADYGQGMIGVPGDYETRVKGVQEAGGITFIDHPGTTTKAYENENPETYYANNPKVVDKYAYLFVTYPSCVGIDVNSGTNDQTIYDDYLYDEILKKTIPYGRTPWAFTFSDAHGPGQYDRAFTVHMLPEKTPAAMRESMEQGTFFSAARHARRILGEDFKGEGALPAVTNVAVNEAAGTISLTAKDYKKITWVSEGGAVVAEGATLNLAANDAKVGSYVRAYLTGPGGILYVQPFTVLREGQTLEKVPVPRRIDYSVVLRFITDAFNFIFAPKYSPLWIIWQMLAHYDPAVDQLLLVLFGR